MVSLWEKYSLRSQNSSPGHVIIPACRIVIVITLFMWSFMEGVFMEMAVQGQVDEDILTPYVAHHGPLHRSHRDTQKCQSVKYGNVTHTRHLASFHSKPVLPLVETHYMVEQIGQYWDKRTTYINHQVVNNPLTTFSVLEPRHPGTCQNGSAERATVETSAQQRQCLLATNAGFFDTTTGECKGNVISDSFLVQDTGGIQNVHFGVTKDGYIYTGYLSELDLVAQDFTQLVGGVVWLVRDGEIYVDESKNIECPDAQETGTVDRFINVISARVAVGHDAEGRIHMVQVNGKTDVMGVNLNEFADLLLRLGLVNAINLDGGGSATLVMNGTLVNYPSDQCVNSTYNCPREVSTILCVHQPECSPADCSGHGSCDIGICQCHGYWTGPACDRLSCPNDCSWHGQCTKDGCQCHPGWKGENCSLPCQDGWYGVNCSFPCVCEHGAVCDAVTGVCQCPPGYSGKYCQTACPFGFYGQDCSEVCFCENSCHCDHVTGSCNASMPDSMFKVGKCLAEQEIKTQHLVPDSGPQYSICVASAVSLSLIAIVSLVVNVVLTYMLVKTRQRHRITLKRKIKLAVKYALQTVTRNDNAENDDEDDEVQDGKQLLKIVGKVSQDDRVMGENEEEGVETGTGEEEDDLFLAPKNGSGSLK